MGSILFKTADSEAVAFFRENGWAVINLLDEEQTQALQGWVNEVMAWRDEDGNWLHYREMTESGPVLCRTENFVRYHEGLRALLTEGRVLETASALLGEPAVLYKEKINYKAAGGAGFAPHQDAPAYRFVQQHVSCMIAIDDADAENGCLEAVSHRHAEVLPMNEDGCIRQDVVDSMEWESIPVPAGSTLWFHSRTPHRSAANNSKRARRALYPTYNASREGDLRDAYYEQKFAEFAASEVDGSRVQVSLINDFQGKPV